MNDPSLIIPLLLFLIPSCDLSVSLSLPLLLPVDLNYSSSLSFHSFSTSGRNAADSSRCCRASRLSKFIERCCRQSCFCKAEVICEVTWGDSRRKEFALPFMVLLEFSKRVPPYQTNFSQLFNLSLEMSSFCSIVSFQQSFT